MIRTSQWNLQMCVNSSHLVTIFSGCHFISRRKNSGFSMTWESDVNFATKVPENLRLAVRAVLAVLLHAWLQCVHCQVLFGHSRLSEVWIDSFVLVKVGHWEFPILMGHNQINRFTGKNSMILEFRGRLGCSFLRKPFSSWHHHSEFLLLRSVVYWCTLVAGFPKGLSENMVPLNPLVYHHCSIQIAIVRHTFQVTKVLEKAVNRPLPAVLFLGTQYLVPQFRW